MQVRYFGLQQYGALVGKPAGYFKHRGHYPAQPRPGERQPEGAAARSAVDAELWVAAGKGAVAVHDGRWVGPAVEAELVEVPGEHVLGLPRLLARGRGEAHPSAAVVEPQEASQVQGRGQHRGSEVVQVDLEGGRKGGGTEFNKS